MMLYVNGDSHTAAAEAVNPHAFCEDDQKYKHLGRLPHPDNLLVSWGKQLAGLTKMTFFCDAESAASNDRIVRTTKQWIENYPGKPDNLFVIIGWSTWEREEWLIDDIYYQVNASGIDYVPESHIIKYKQYIASVDWNQKTIDWHYKIHALHDWLDENGVKHIFFNCNNNFSEIQDREDWGDSYISPYSDTYDSYLRQQGQIPLNSYHYDEHGHSIWSKFLLMHILKNNLL